jgi:precorrin-6A/cobalt-precorrin-6A reductase
MRVLILGGTSEARELSALVAPDRRFEVTISLAGRTRAPEPQASPIRVGGFGGEEGLEEWLRIERIDVVVDATHPFADRISANAVAACARGGIPLGSIVRPPWERAPGDNWTEVPDVEAASAAIGEAPRRVFLTVGRLELPAFAAAPQHDYLARTIDPPGDVPLPPRLTLITERRPFDIAAETRLMRERKIEVLVSKNSGGAATYPKIEAARRLGIPVVMIARPVKSAGTPLAHAVAAYEWLAALASRHGTLRSARGV